MDVSVYQRCPCKKKGVRLPGPFINAQDILPNEDGDISKQMNVYTGNKDINMNNADRSLRGR